MWIHSEMIGSIAVLQNRSYFELYVPYERTTDIWD